MRPREGCAKCAATRDDEALRLTFVEQAGPPSKRRRIGDKPACPLHAHGFTLTTLAKALQPLAPRTSARRVAAVASAFMRDEHGVTPLGRPKGADVRQNYKVTLYTHDAASDAYTAVPGQCHFFQGFELREA